MLNWANKDTGGHLKTDSNNIATGTGTDFGKMVRHHNARPREPHRNKLILLKKIIFFKFCA